MNWEYTIMMERAVNWEEHSELYFKEVPNARLQ